MKIDDIRKKYGLAELQVEKPAAKPNTIDAIREKYGLGEYVPTRDKVETIKSQPRLYENVKKELDAATERRNVYDNEKNIRSSGVTGKIWQKRYGNDNTSRIEELSALIKQEDKRIQELTEEASRSRLYKYESFTQNKDFKTNSAYDNNVKPTVANQLYRQVNNPDLRLTNEEHSDAPREITSKMTEEEVSIFNYLYNTQGDKAAREYFDYLKTDAPDPLNARQGKAIAENIKTDVGRAIYGGIAAVDNTTQGVKQLFTSEAVKPTVAQYASAQAAEDIETKVGKFAYDLSATVGNMAPSILASALVGVVNPLLGKAVGSTLMGAASAGNTYTDAINSGMTPRQAMKYGAMVGASEAALGSILGGISKLGANPIGKAAGKLVSGGKFAKAIGAVDNAFIRAAAKLAGSMAGEIAEEELQLFLEPLFKTMATDEKYDAPEWEEIVYTALISAASAGLFEAPANISEAVQESRQKKAEKILNDAIAEHKKQSKAAENAQSEADAANADFAKEGTAETEQQTANDTNAAKMPLNEDVDAFTQMVRNYADGMDANGQNAFVSLYDSSVEPDVYVREMQDAYNAGRKGETLTTTETTIGDERRQLAYNAGIADKATADASYGFVHNEASKTVDRKLVQNLNRAAKALKVKIQFADEIRGGTAEGVYRNGVITIDRNAKGGTYMEIAKHEITHHLEKTAPVAYSAYQRYALETLAGNYGISVEQMVQDRIAQAAVSGDSLTADEAKAEIAADFAKLILTDEKALRKFVEANSKTAEGRNMLQRLFDAIRRFIAKVTSGKTKYTQNTELIKEMGLNDVSIAQLEKAERLYREVLKESAEQRAGVSGDSGKAQMSIVALEDGKMYVEASRKVIKGTSLEEMRKDLTRFFNLLLGEQPLIAIPTIYGDVLTITKKDTAEKARDNYKEINGKAVMMSLKEFAVKARMTAHIDELAEIAKTISTTKKPDRKNHDFAKDGFTYPKAYFRDFDGQYYEITLSVGHNGSVATVYNVGKIKGSISPSAKILAGVGSKPLGETTSKQNISQPGTSVKSQKSAVGGDSLEVLRKKYGEIKPGEHPFREAHVPRKTEKHKNVSQTVRTIIEAKAIPETILPDIEELVKSGAFSYEAYGDEAAINKAKKKISTDAGWEDSKKQWFAEVGNGKISKDMTTMGWVLYNNAANMGDTYTAVEILRAMVGQQRSAAQALQATRILKKLDPETQLYGIVRSVDSLQQELVKKYGDKAPELKLDQTLSERVLTAASEKARDEAMHDIYRDIGGQMPSTFLDKWNAWRYLAMLGNVRTHVRNIAGNTFFVPVVTLKNATATAIEGATRAVLGDKFERTKALPTKELIAAAFEDYASIPEPIKADGKYDEKIAANKYIQEGRQVFDNKVLEAARRFNGNALTAEDEFFERRHYAVAMAQYCKANGITAEMLKATEGGNKARVDKARAYAIKEAYKATYKDANAFSEWVNKRPKSKAGRLIVDAVLPFRKTPANILVRAVEYSPVGLVKSTGDLLFRVRKGKISAAQAIDGLAAGLTGTLLVGLGVLLAKMGIVRGMNGDEEEERKFNELQGYQGYALEAWDRTYTLDWLAPEAMPFFIGVNIAEAKSLEDKSLSELLEMVGNISAPLLEMSCLQSLNDMIEAIGTTYGSGLSALYKAPINAATSYLTQALPTIFGQVERITESTRQQTYTDKNNKVLTEDMQYTLGKAFNKLPLEVGQIPYIDAWGRETSTGNVGVRAFNNLLNPGYSAKIRTSPMEKELQRLYDETGEASVLPDRPQKYIKIKGEKIDLNKNQYVKYATIKGQTSYEMLTKITASAQYKKMDKQSKVDIVSKVYSYANAVAKMEVTKTQKDKDMRYKLDGWIAEADATAKATGLPTWKYLLIYDGQTGIKGLKDKNGDTISLSSSLLVMEHIYSFAGLSDAQRQALYEDFDVAKSVRHYDKQRVAQELKKMRAKAK